MIHEKLYKNYAMVNDSDVLFVFKGTLTQSILVELGSAVRNKLAKEKQIRKIFSVFVELAQNIDRYSAIREQNEISGIQAGVGIILISKTDNYYCISSGNAVENVSAVKIRNKLDYINSLNIDELKDFYLESRKAGPDSDSKGAGIGFIEIARKSGSDLDYKIKGIDEKYSFLTISVKIIKEE